MTEMGSSPAHRTGQSEEGLSGAEEILKKIKAGAKIKVYEGKTPFTQASLNRIKDLKKFYGLELDSRASHRLKEDEKKRRPSR